MTDVEIRDVLEQLHSPRRFEVGEVANRVAELVQAGVVEEAAPRINPRTRRLNRAVFIPATQAQLFPGHKQNRLPSA
ncbi:hypothetical protein D9M69_624840 [compost metagenome]